MTGKRRLEPGSPEDKEPIPPTEPIPPAEPEPPAEPIEAPEPIPAPPPVESPPSMPLDASALVIAPQLTRRQARLARRRQRNRRVGVVGGVAIAVVVIVLVALGVFVGPKVVNHYSTSSPKPVQTTLLLQIQGSDRTAPASVLLAQGPAAAQGVEVLIPARVLSVVCGYGTQNFGDILALPGGEAATTQVLTAMLNGVTVDGSWVLPEATLAKLVDNLHGITANVDVNVLHRNSNGSSSVLVPAGNGVKLSGAQAAAYATYSASGNEDASAQQARLQQVVDGILTALPSSPADIAAQLRRLGSAGGSTLGVTRLASVLAGLAAAERSESGLFPTDLPVSPIDSGGAPSYQVDDTSATGVAQLVSSHLAASVPPGGGKPEPSVYLLNGTGDPRQVPSACPRLTAGGLAFAGSNNASTFSSTARSVIEIGSDSSADVALGDRVAKALGLSASDVERDPQDQNIADVIVTLGSDYRE
jgi:hypothetical protein